MNAYVLPCGSTFKSTEEESIEFGIEKDESLINQSDQIGFEVYPNPNNGIFFIQPFDNSVQYNIVMFDLQGKIVLSTNNLMGEQNIDVLNLAKGYYMLKVISGNKVFVEKLILE
jgi:hypothetical protein